MGRQFLYSSPTGQPIPPIAQGSQTYAVSTKGNGPKISSVTIDPFDPKMGERQAFRIAIASAYPVQNVLVTLTTDSSVTTYKLVGVEGYTMDGVWEGGWVTTDTHNYTYQATISAFTSSSTTSTAILSFR